VHPQIPLMSPSQAVEAARRAAGEWTREYLAMYSSLLGGIVTEPWLMNLPVDEHMVHRGDGVFEACKCVGGKAYLWDRHLKRLARSAQAVGLALPWTEQELTHIARATAAASGEMDLVVRIYVGRGPGGFSADPRECQGPTLYIVLTRLHPPGPEAYEQGVSLALVGLAPRGRFYAGIKTCNYLPSALVRLSAAAKGADYGVWVDPEGMVGEGATENIAIVDEDGWVCLPMPGAILEGITVGRLRELAPSLADQGVIKGLRTCPLRPRDLFEAREVMLIGTTIDVLPATVIDGRRVGDGRPGPVARALRQLLVEDLVTNPSSTTQLV